MADMVGDGGTPYHFSGLFVRDPKRVAKKSISTIGNVSVCFASIESWKLVWVFLSVCFYIYNGNHM